jgi:hypothetical protein
VPKRFSAPRSTRGTTKVTLLPGQLVEAARVLLRVLGEDHDARRQPEQVRLEQAALLARIAELHERQERGPDGDDDRRLLLVAGE